MLKSLYSQAPHPHKFFHGAALSLQNCSDCASKIRFDLFKQFQIPIDP